MEAVPGENHLTDRTNTPVGRHPINRQGSSESQTFRRDSTCQAKVGCRTARGPQPCPCQAEAHHAQGTHTPAGGSCEGTREQARATARDSNECSGNMGRVPRTRRSGFALRARRPIRRHPAADERLPVPRGTRLSGSARPRVASGERDRGICLSERPHLAHQHPPILHEAPAPRLQSAQRSARKCMMTRKCRYTYGPRNVPQPDGRANGVRTMWDDFSDFGDDENVSVRRDAYTPPIPSSGTCEEVAGRVGNEEA